MRSSSIKILLLLIGIVLFSLLLWYQNTITNWAWPNHENPRGQYITTLITLIGGVGLFIGLWLTHRRSKAMEYNVANQTTQLELTRKSQVDERFKNAIEHLANTKMTIAIGGITELVQVAKEEPLTYAQAVSSIFSEYIKVRCSVAKKPNATNQTVQYIINNLFNSSESNPFHNVQTDLSRCILVQFNFDYLKICNTNLTSCHLGHIRKAQFHNCRLVHVKLFNVQLSHLTFKKSNLGNLVTYFSSLIECKIEDCTLDSAIFLDASFTNVEFRDASRWPSTSINFLGCTFYKTDFKWTLVRDCTFVGSRFDGIDFGHARIEECDFSATIWPIVSLLELWKFRNCIFYNAVTGGVPSMKFLNLIYELGQKKIKPIRKGNYDFIVGSSSFEQTYNYGITSLDKFQKYLRLHHQIVEMKESFDTSHSEFLEALAKMRSNN